MAEDETKELDPSEEPEATAVEEAPVATATDDDEEKEFEFVEDPVFEVDDKGDCAYEVKVTIPIANEEKLTKEVFDELKHEALVPGFRKGRAPLKLIERKFSKAVRNDVEGRLVKAAFMKLMQDKKFDPLAPPEADGFNEERKPEEPISFTLKFEVQPKVELGKYRGVEVERPVYTIEEKDIDTAIADIQSRFSVFETVEGATAQDGDQVIITFKGIIDGEAFQGGSAENYPYILGSKRFFPEFEKVLVGAKAGDTLQCEITFPDSYSAEHLRGRTAQFEITMNELKRRNVPEVTDEFATQSGYESVQDLREKTAARLNDGSARESNEIAEGRALKQVIEGSTFQIPKSLVESMAHEFYEETVKDLRTKRMPASYLEEHEEEIRANTREEALGAIKTWTVLNEIAEAEGIEVTDEDFEQEALSLSQRTGTSVEMVTKYLGDEEQRNRVERRMLHAKVMAAIMSHAVITDKEVSHEELDQEEAAQQDA